MQLAHLLEGLPVHWLRPGDADIRSLTVDEREVRPGALYVARRGYYGDGHERLAAALDAGAAALVVNDADRVPSATSVPTAVIEHDPALLGELSARFYDHPTAELILYGVTGTNGKTSVVTLVEHMLRALGERPAVMGTIDYRYGATSHPAINTTPDALFLHRFARQARDAGATSLVLEVSSHGLALGRTAGLLFDRVGFTNLSHEHLDFHGTMAAYREAKRRLFTDYLGRSLAAGKSPVAAACVDAADGRTMIASTPSGVATVSVATDPNAPGTDVTIEALEWLGVRGSRFRIASPWGSWTGRTPLFGRYNLANLALAATLAASDEPSRWAAVLASMEHFAGVSGRLEPVHTPTSHEQRVFVDYAHSPDALHHALSVLRDLNEGPVTVVVGCGGDRDRGKRPLMARVAQQGADRVILTSDNPRSEDPDRILDEMHEGLSADGPRVERVTDRSDAIERAFATERGGLVLIAGKGHERYQEHNGVRYHLDDREEVRRALAGRRLGHSARDTPLVDGWSDQRIAQILTGSAPTRQDAFRQEQRLDAVDLVAAAAARGTAWQLIGAIVTDACTRPGGLWTAWVVAPPSRPAGLLAAKAPLEPALVVPWTEHVPEFADAMAMLTPAHRGLVISLPLGAASLPVDLAAHVAADILVEPTERDPVAWTTAEVRASAVVVVTLEQLAARSASHWAQDLERARAAALRRHRQHAEPRPIPVPDSLKLA